MGRQEISSEASRWRGKLSSHCLPQDGAGNWCKSRKLHLCALRRVRQLRQLRPSRIYGAEPTSWSGKGQSFWAYLWGRPQTVSWQASFEELRGRNAEAERQRREELAKKELEAAQAEAEAEAATPGNVQPQVEAGDTAVAEEETKEKDADDDVKKKANEETQDEDSESVEEIPKVFSFFNLPPSSEELGDEVVDNAISVILNTDFPALAAFLGVPVSDDKMPPVDEVRGILGLETEEMKSLFQENSAQSVGGRVCAFSGRRLKSAEELLKPLKRRCAEHSPAAVEVFLEPGEEEEEEDEVEEDKVRIFVFLQRDLPRVNPEDVEDLEWISQSLGIITSTLCVSQILTQTNLTDDVLEPLEIWPWDSDTWQLFMDGIENVLPLWPLTPALLATLVAGLLARRGVAQRQGLDIIQIPLPRLNRAADFDIAAASPVAMLAISSALLALGIVQVQRSVVAPLQLPAVQLPASLAAALGYPIPVQSDDQLVTLSTNLDALKAMPLVPMDALLLGGSLGLTAAAASLLPVAGFDGHQIARAAFGVQSANFLEFMSLTALCLEVGRDDLRGTFASEIILIFMIQLLFGRRADEVMPPQDNVTAVGLERQIAASVLLATSVTVLLPAEAWEALKIALTDVSRP